MSLFAELQRRNVIRMAGLYLVTAWLLVQVASTVFPAFDLPAWTVRAIILVLALGFVPALVLAWVFEVTPDGLRREGDARAVDAPVARQAAKRIDRMIVAGLVAVIALMAVERLWFARQETPAAPAAAADPAGPIDAIAVLPFRNEGGGADTEYLSDGVTESLIYRLARVRELTVSPVSSVSQFKGAAVDHLEAGRRLAVKAIVAGRLLQRGDDLDIGVELIDVRTNRVLWGERYRRKASDLLQTQRDIAAEVTERLRLQLSGEDAQRLAKRYTSSNEAYRLYLQGRFQWNKRTEAGLRAAIESFRQAGDADPEFALAFTGLADCYAVMPYYRSMRSAEALDQAAPFAARALEIDSELAEAHTSTAYIQQGRWQFDEAERSYQRALELDPRYATAQFWYARLEARLGRSEASLQRMRAAQQLEPLSRVISENIAQMLLAAGEVDASLAEAKRLVALDPDYPSGHLRIAEAYLHQGRAADALAAAEQGLARADLSRLRMARARALAALGRSDEARAVAEELEAAHARGDADAAEVGGAWASVGEAERAFAWLERARDERSMLLVDIRTMDNFRAMKGDPRFAALLSAMGLPP